MNVLVTGATGFIGSRIIELLDSSEQFTPIAAVRLKHTKSLKKVHTVLVDELGPETYWENALEDIHVVIHTAARAHIINDEIKNPISEFRKVNVAGTLNLAREAANLGIKRFIFLSSIGVNGINNNTPFTEQDTPAPIQDYACSKFEAEQGLIKIAESTEMDIVIIRPPLVYGPNAPGNFKTLMRWMNKNIPLPLGAIHNKRSFVALDNLVDLILTCIEHPAAANQIFLVADGEDLSTTELLNRVAKMLGKKPRLLPVNEKLLEFVLNLIGKKALAQRLCGSLQVDISKTKKLLNWSPPLSFDEELSKTAQQFLESQSV